MDTEPHQGFTNYATFSVAVVVDNDRGPYYATLELVRHTRDSMATRKATREGRDPECIVADALKDDAEAKMPELDGYWSSLLQAGWSEVDWLDLARHWLGDLEELERETAAR